MTPRETELIDLIFRLCDRIYAAHEVIGKNAERKERNEQRERSIGTEAT